MTAHTSRLERGVPTPQDGLWPVPGRTLCGVADKLKRTSRGWPQIVLGVGRDFQQAVRRDKKA
jgi:hypothetical protein